VLTLVLTPVLSFLSSDPLTALQASTSSLWLLELETTRAVY